MSSFPLSVRGSSSRSSARARPLVAREPVVDELPERHEVDLAAGARLHDRMHLLAPLVVGHPEDGRVHHVGMRVEHGLDLGRIDVHPAADDHVLLAVADVDEALLVDPRHVADRLPFAASGGGLASSSLSCSAARGSRPSRGWCGCRARPARRAGVEARFVDHLELDVAVGPPARARLAQLVLGAEHGVDADSVEPYTSKRNPSPSFSITSCFNAYGTGAALAMSVRIDEQSAWASTSSGSDTMRLSCVGALNVVVTRCSLHEPHPLAASNLRITTTVPPRLIDSDANAIGPEW